PKWILTSAYYPNAIVDCQQTGFCMTLETDAVDLGPGFFSAEENTLENVIDYDRLLLCRPQNGDSNNFSVGLIGGSSIDGENHYRNYHFKLKHHQQKALCSIV
ncbi:hypothetical protein STEG23_025867, partial [Scotinomys teguina]